MSDALRLAPKIMTMKFPDPAAAERLDRLVKTALKVGANAADAIEFKMLGRRFLPAGQIGGRGPRGWPILACACSWATK